MVIALLSINVNLVNSQGGIGPDGKYKPPLRLSFLYPDYDNFKGKIKYFEWKSFRRIDSQYLKPDIEKWVSTLKEIKDPDLHQKHVKICFKDKKARYFYVQEDTSFGRRFFAVNGDTIDVLIVNGEEILNMLTPSGVAFWRYFYKDGRLRALKMYSMMPDIREKLELPDRLRSVANYIYFDEEREVYFDSTEFKDKLDWFDYRTRFIDKERFDYSVSGGRNWYDGW
jgi:hypothetical protein